MISKQHINTAGSTIMVAMITMTALLSNTVWADNYTTKVKKAATGKHKIFPDQKREPSASAMPTGLPTMPVTQFPDEIRDRSDISSLNITISALDAKYIGDLIFKNETSGRVEKLVHWNRAETFPSLGIGHFIWYPKGQDGPFVEDFPRFIAYLNEKGIKLPFWLSPRADCP